MSYFTCSYSFLFFVLELCRVIDGTHMRICVFFKNQIPFINRKNVSTQNIMVACSFDMQFMFVWVMG